MIQEIFFGLQVQYYCKYFGM